MPRLVLIHALRQSAQPIEEAFARAWPEATLVSVLDATLSADLAAAGRLDARMTDRFLELGRYAVSLAPDALLFTCSAFGPCIEAVRTELAPLPVRRPSEAMVAEASAIGGRIALVATYAPTLASMPSEFPSHVEIEPIFVEGALAALNEGDPDRHDHLVAEAVRGVGCDAVALSQYSLARAAPAVAGVMNVPVLTTPNAAVRELRQALER